MKTLKHLVAAVAALSILTSCSVLKGLTSSAASAGSNTGSAIAAIYNIFKSTGGIDLNNITTLINLGKILSGAQSLTGATEAFTSDFTSGLISGSSNLVNSANVASVLAALNYGDYLLLETVEQHTPIGVKLVFERWVNTENEAYYKLRLIYQSTAQLRSKEQLTLENPRVIYPLPFAGMDAEGRIAEGDLFKLLDDTISAYDALVERYTAEKPMDDAA